MLDWIDLEGVGWLRLTELEADEKKKRGCADFLELDRFELGGILALCPVFSAFIFLANAWHPSAHTHLHRIRILTLHL